VRETPSLEARSSPGSSPGESWPAAGGGSGEGSSGGVSAPADFAWLAAAVSHTSPTAAAAAMPRVDDGGDHSAAPEGAPPTEAPLSGSPLGGPVPQPGPLMVLPLRAAGGGAAETASAAQPGARSFWARATTRAQRRRSYSMLSGLRLFSCFAPLHGICMILYPSYLPPQVCRLNDDPVMPIPSSSHGCTPGLRQLRIICNADEGGGRDGHSAATATLSPQSPRPTSPMAGPRPMSPGRLKESVPPAPVSAATSPVSHTVPEGCAGRV